MKESAINNQPAHSSLEYIIWSFYLARCDAKIMRSLLKPQCLDNDPDFEFLKS